MGSGAGSPNQARTWSELCLEQGSHHCSMSGPLLSRPLAGGRGKTPESLFQEASNPLEGLLFKTYYYLSAPISQYHSFGV